MKNIPVSMQFVGIPCFMLIETTKTYETLEASKEWNSFTIVDLEVRKLN